MADGATDVVLTDVQMEFLRRFITGRKFFVPRKDRETTEAYKKFIKVEAAAQEYLGKLDPAGPDAARVAALLRIATDQKNSSHFDQAFATAQQALVDAAEVDRRAKRKNALLQRLNGTTIPDRASAVHRGLMTDTVTRITAALAGNPPSTEDMDAAETDLTRLENLRANAETEMRDRDRDALSLSQAEREARSRLNTIKAQIDRVAEGNSRDTLEREAARLDEQIDAMREAVMTTDLAPLSSDVEEIDDVRTQLDQLAADTATALKDDMLDIEIMRYRTASDIEALKNLAVADPELKDAAAAALDNFDRTLQGRTVDQADVMRAELRVEDAQTEVNLKRAARDAADQTKRQLATTLRQARWDAESPIIMRKNEANAAATDFYERNKVIMEDDTHDDYDAVWDRYELEFEAPYEAAKAELAAERQRLLADETAQFRATDEALNQARADLVAAKTDRDEALEEQRCIEGKKRLLDAITFGPLSPERQSAMSSVDKAALMQLYTVNPRLADCAVTRAAGAEHPESVVSVAQCAAARVDANFGATRGSLATDAGAQRYAEALVNMSAGLSPDQAAELGAYLDADRHLQPVPAVLAEHSAEYTGKKRVDHVGKALVGDDGRLDFDQARAAFQDVIFHPDAVTASPSMAQVQHMSETLEFLEGSNDAQDVIFRMSDPQGGGAALLAGANRKPMNEVDKKDAQVAVVTAMMTPVYQGPVGSCFTTGPLLKLRDDEPLDLMQGFAKLATEGVFEPKVGEPLPAVQNVPREENALMRSFEYTAATATARLADSRERKKVGKMVGRAAQVLGKALKVKLPKEEQDAVHQQMMDAVDFQYRQDATADGGDGQSSRGRFVLTRKSDGREIDSPLAFVAAVVKPLADRKGKLSKSEMTRLRKIAADPRFAAAMTVRGETPWALESGGFDDEAALVLEGRETVPEKMNERVDPATLNRDNRAKALVADITGHIGLTRETTVGASTSGEYNHAFNLLPNHPTMTPFYSPDPDTVAENVETKMLVPGRQAAATQMPVERVVYLFDREMEALVSGAEGDARDTLKLAWAANTPTTPMTPRQFAAHLAAATDQWADDEAQAGADRWNAREIAAGKPPDAAALAAEKTKRKTGLENWRDGALTDRLIADFKLPHIVLADTNWGSPEGHVFFALAPDPLSGEPRLFRKIDPPGKLTPMDNDENWLAAKWYANL